MATEMEQLNVRIPKDLIASLKEAASRFPNRSVNQVVAEILVSYFAHWDDADATKAEKIANLGKPPAADPKRVTPSQRRRTG